MAKLQARYCTTDVGLFIAKYAFQMVEVEAFGLYRFWLERKSRVGCTISDAWDIPFCIFFPLSFSQVALKTPA